MPLTELITLHHVPPNSFESLSRIYTFWCSLQPSYSSYPLTFYADVRLPGVMYLLTGWHSAQERDVWRQSDEYREIRADMMARVEVKRSLVLNMDFDTIPRAARGLMCVHTIRIGEDEEEEDESMVWTSSNDSFLEVLWTGCGEDCEDASLFCRLTLYGARASDETVRRKYRVGSDYFTAMRRIAVPVDQD
ncbi:uncharacterized protein ARMOST_15683 [Armillaria ostoyae]|uniref:ABM domain-containing protein n=1 Tax=Armillaria ostoyae TaxID=47428 RepID=A0A284RU70_ARMOS|nr:uncharacterized protein ARMOST_15683 [Armillaria ostoyae]